ncbi:iron-sulfur cluster assembly scaffold protein [Pyrinomonas sp.]|uniref:iron-sulfur cluster assembly scaffold protein n=1 Tax=Pyrinomonas sp. TaxID=2080306 RepID=UPI0033315C71
MSSGYSKVFKDHLARPRNAGALPEADAVAEQMNPICGDRLCLALRVRGGRIVEARFLAYGCPPTLVCGSMLTEMLRGMSLEEAAALSRQQLIEAIGGLPSRRAHAAALAIETLRAALLDLEAKRERSRA